MGSRSGSTRCPGITQRGSAAGGCRPPFARRAPCRAGSHVMETSPGAGGLGRRIVVIGTTGSGKTTLARRLSQLLDIPHVELDALNWEPDWVQAPTEVFRQRTEEALRGEAWLVDGNYSAVRDIVWPRAGTLVWLGFRFLVTPTPP